MTINSVGLSSDEVLRLRGELAIVDHYAYLNHAAIGPLTRRGVDRLAGLALTIAATGDRRWPERNAEAERVRGLAARLIGAREPHEVAFVENTSTGLSAVAEGLDWKRGERVVGAQGEFPSNVYPWMHLGDRGVAYVQVHEHGGRIDPEDIIAALDERTRILALSWVQYSTGFRSDLARLGAACRARGILFVVDAIQGLGALALDVERDSIDVLAASAHKWLLGSEGIGLLYVSDRVIEQLRPPRAGWRSTATPYDWTHLDLTFATGAKRFESGTLNGFGIHAFGGALEIFLETGPAKIEQRVLALAERAAAGLIERGWTLAAPRRDGETSGIVAATRDGADPEKLVEALALQGIVASARAGRLRVSPHAYNTEEEIDRLLAALG